MERSAATRPVNDRMGRRVPVGVLNGIDLLILVLAVWCVVVPLLTARELHIPLPFGNYISSTPSSHNLVFVWLLLFVRAQLEPRPGCQTWARRLVPDDAPVFEGLIVLVAFLLVFLVASQQRLWPSGDTIPAKLLPISILEERNMDLNEFAPGIFEGRRYSLYWTGGRALSVYPPATALTALPVYGLFALLAPEAFHSWRWAYAIPDGDDLPNVANLMERYAAALIAALAALVFWRFCRAVTGDRRASLWFALACGLGTSLLSTASQALWQHGPACLFLGLMILLLWKAHTGGSWALLAAGLSAGWAYACRPTVAPMVAVLSLWVLKKFRRRSLWFGVPCGLIVAGMAAYNWAVFGRLSGGYAGNIESFMPFDGRVTLALLFSPSRGLFVFSPFLLFGAAIGLRQVVKAPLGLPAFCFYGALAHLVLFSCWQTWSGGSAFGPRYLCEAALLLALLLPFGCRAIVDRRVVWPVFLLAVFFACHLHLLGARHGDHNWTTRKSAGDDLSAAWRWQDSQLVWTLGRGGK